MAINKEAQPISVVKKFEIYLRILDDARYSNGGVKTAFSYEWRNGRGETIVLSYSDLFEILALARKGVGYE